MQDGPFPGFGPRATATMEAIELAALREFTRRGFHETTAEHIAIAAGSSVRTFFRYFPGGKEDVMVLQVRRWAGHVTAAMGRRPPEEPAWRALRESVRVTSLLDADSISTDAVFLHRELARSAPGLHERMTGHHHALAEPLVEMCAARMGVDRHRDLRPRLMVHATIAAAMVAWLAWLADDELDAVAAYEQGLDLLERGMAAGAAPAASSAAAARR